MPGLRQALLNNLGIKITSLVLVVAVYAHVYARQEQEIVLHLPLEIAHLPAGLAWRGEVPGHVRVRLRARGAELLKLRAQPPHVVISLGQAVEGRLQRPVTITDVALPPKAEASAVELVEPVVLSLSIELLTTVTRPVVVSLRGRPAQGFALDGAPQVVPETLSVTGPRSQVAQLDTLRTVPLDLDGKADAFATDLRLDPPAGVRPRVDHVAVRVRLTRAGRRSVGGLAVSLPVALRRGWRAEPESAMVEISGAEDVLRGLNRREIRVRVQAAEPLDPDEPLGLQVVLPVGVRDRIRVERVDPATVLLVPRTR